MNRMSPIRYLAVASVAFVLVACGGSSGGSDGGSESSPSAGGELIVQAASYDIAANEPGRFIAGVLTADQLFVSYGEVEMDFSYLGAEDGGDPQPGPSATGEFLAIEGDADRSGPIAATASSGRGVYAAEVAFDQAGFWNVELTADVEGRGTLSGSAAFEVKEEHLVPAVGEKAPRTENLTPEARDGASLAAIDSRAGEGEPIPDPELHEMTVAESIRSGRPTLVVISTPVYCVSRFCGPITDMVSEFAQDYSNKANFVHIEVWRDFEKQQINRGAAEWIFRGGDFTEPWVFLVDEDGQIEARWDNVAIRSEIEPLLEKL